MHHQNNPTGIITFRVCTVYRDTSHHIQSSVAALDSMMLSSESVSVPLHIRSNRSLVDKEAADRDLVDTEDRVSSGGKQRHGQYAGNLHKVAIIGSVQTILQ